MDMKERPAISGCACRTRARPGTCPPRRCPRQARRSTRNGQRARRTPRVFLESGRRGCSAVGVPASAGAAARTRASVVVALCVAVHAGVADRLLSAGIAPRRSPWPALPASTPSRRRITKVRALVGAGRSAWQRAFLREHILMSGTKPSLTSSSAIRSGVSARLRRIGASHFSEHPVGVVARVVDRALGLRRRAGEVVISGCSGVVHESA